MLARARVTKNNKKFDIHVVKMNLTQEIHLINRVQPTLESNLFNKTIKFEGFKEQSPKDAPTEPA